MGVLKRRTRLISFRVSDDEYRALVEMTNLQNARSISDFSRTAVCQALKGNSNGNSNHSTGDPDGASLNYARELIKSMQELGSVITRLSGQIDRESMNLIKR
jgi:hypothetical protein